MNVKLIRWSKWSDINNCYNIERFKNNLGKLLEKNLEISSDVLRGGNQVAVAWKHSMLLGYTLAIDDFGTPWQQSALLGNLDNKVFMLRYL